MSLSKRLQRQPASTIFNGVQKKNKPRTIGDGFRVSDEVLCPRGVPGCSAWREVNRGDGLVGARGEGRAAGLRGPVSAPGPRLLPFPVPCPRGSHFPGVLRLQGWRYSRVARKELRLRQKSSIKKARAGFRRRRGVYKTNPAAPLTGWGVYKRNSAAPLTGAEGAGLPGAGGASGGGGFG